MGREVIDRFIEQAPNHLKTGGRIELLVSNINNPEEVITALRKKGLKAGITASEKIWFEELFIIVAKRI